MFSPGLVVMILTTLLNLTSSFPIYSLLVFLICMAYIFLWILVNQVRKHIRVSSMASTGEGNNCGIEVDEEVINEKELHREQEIDESQLYIIECY